MLDRAPGPAQIDLADAARQTITLDYPFEPRVRYGHGLPVHPELDAIIGARRDAYRERLTQFVGLTEDLLQIPSTTNGELEPSWANTWFTSLDAAALYCTLAIDNPAHYIEVGSGNSTRFARRAIKDHGLRTELISLDPQPRVEVDGLCDRVIRERLEETDLRIFDILGDGDVLLLDGSHRSFQNSDVTVQFLEVLPRLTKGVQVQIHDIFLPADYGPFIGHRYYSEQYLLAMMLLGGGGGFEIVLPNYYILHDTELRAVLDPLLNPLAERGHSAGGLSFWMRRTS